ncbi:MAG: NarK/NasA family nitrate transporter [Planctomycetes bacterium]|nr:NarK/NasA family nitrate transporter [Planctomycetota bacterium]
MNIRDFLKAGHVPTLFCAFLHFDISFMVWVLIGALANSIVPEFGLSETQRGLIVAVPLLGGAILRILLGFMTDHFGAKTTGVIGLIVTLVPLLLGWLWADSFEKILIVGLMLGVAGASFASSLPLASRWYPPQHQGLAMGIAGAGNSGTALATFFAPRIAEIPEIGWHGVFGLAIIPVVVTLVLYCFLAKDSPAQPEPLALADYFKVLGTMDTWWFCIFYSVTFGGFVGLASFLNSFFKVEYGLSAIAAGGFATLCVISGSLLRPIGGYLADRFGGIRMLIVLFLGVAATMLGMGFLPDLYVAAALLFLGMGCLGMGNGSVFQLVPLRFKNEIGVITGVVGAAGGIGGFFLPTALGYLKDQTGAFAGGFFAFAAAGLLCAGMLALVSRSWEGVFVLQGGKANTMSESPEPVQASA